MVGLVVLFTQPARRAKANRADGQQGQQPFHRERVARLGDSGVLYGRGLGGSRSRGRGGRGRSDRCRSNGGHAVPLGVQGDIAGNSAVKAEAVLAALLGIPAAEHPAVLFGGGRLAGLVAAYKGLAGNIGPAMPAQVKALTVTSLFHWAVRVISRSTVTVLPAAYWLPAASCQPAN